MTPSASPFHSSTDLPRRAIWWTLAAVLLTFANLSNGGRYSPLAMIWLSLAIGSAAFGTFALRLSPKLGLNSVLCTACVWFGALNLQSYFSVIGPPRALQFIGFLALSTFIALGIAFIARHGMGRILFAIFLILQLSFRIWTVQSAHDYEETAPQFRLKVRHDVQFFNREAARLLIAGQNPYAVRMLNVMGHDMPFYPPNTTRKDGKLPFGYVYMPLGLFFIVPGYLLGDFRFAHVFAIIGTAFFLATARPSKTSQLAAMLFLLFPQMPFVLILSWTEPVALFFAAATLWCHFRAPKWTFLALGCLICAKQYTVFLLPILPLLVPERKQWAPLMGKSLVVALLLTLPMALWSIDGFFRSAVQMQFKQPFRADSLSYLALVLRMGGPQLSPIFGFAALIGGLIWGARRAPRGVLGGASGWMAAGAGSYLGFFAFNKQAFANYYFWVFGLLLAAVAVALPAETDHEKTG